MKNVHIHILDADPILRPHASKIKKEISRTLDIVSKHILIEDLDIVVLHNPKVISYGIASSNIALNNHGFFVSMNVTHKNFNTLLRNGLLEVFSSGLYFVDRYKKTGFPKLLIDSFIAEGIALHFEMACAHTQAPSFCNISQKKFRELLININKYIFLRDYDWDEWFYGDKKKHIPAKSISIIGFHLIKNYLNAHTTKTIFDLIDMNPTKLRNDILRLENIKRPPRSIKK